MADPIVQDIVFSRTPATAPANTWAWDVRFVAVTSAGTRFVERKGFGTLGAGLTVAQVKAAIAAVAVAYDTAEKNPPAPDLTAFPGTFDAVSGATITASDDTRLPPGVTP